MSELHPLARAALRGLKAPDPEHREQLLATGVIDLASNLAPEGGPLASYPPLRPRAVQRAYVEALARLDGGGHAKLDAEQVMLTCGSVDAINLLVAAFCEPGRDRVCVCPPTFPFYARAAAANDVEVRAASLAGDEFERLDIAGIAAADAKLTFVCSPSNPVGSVIALEQVEAALEATRGLVVVDEAYVEFSRQPSALALLERHDRLVVLRTLSKAWALAGARLGLAIAGPEILSTLRAIQLTFAVGSPSLAAATEVLGAVEPALRRIEAVRAQRDALAAALRGLACVTRIHRSEANFLLVRFADAQRVFSELLAAGILVGDTRAQVPDSLRISVGTPAQCHALLDTLARL